MLSKVTKIFSRKISKQNYWFSMVLKTRMQPKGDCNWNGMSRKLNQNLLVSGRVIEVIPTLRGDDIRQGCVSKNNTRKGPPCSTKPHSSSPTHSAGHKCIPGVLVHGSSAVCCDCTIYHLWSYWHWVSHGNQLAVLH